MCVDPAHHIEASFAETDQWFQHRFLILNQKMNSATLDVEIQCGGKVYRGVNGLRYYPRDGTHALVLPRAKRQLPVIL